MTAVTKSMEKSIEKNVSKKFVLVVVGIFLVAIIFVGFILIDWNEGDEMKKNVTQDPFRKKTTEEIMKDLSVPPTAGEVSSPAPREVMDSLTAPDKTVNDSSGGGTDKISHPTSVPVEVIVNLTAPTK